MESAEGGVGKGSDQEADVSGAAAVNMSTGGPPVAAAVVA